MGRETILTIFVTGLIIAVFHLYSKLNSLLIIIKQIQELNILQDAINKVEKQTIESIIYEFEKVVYKND